MKQHNFEVVQLEPLVVTRPLKNYNNFPQRISHPIVTHTFDVGRSPPSAVYLPPPRPNRLFSNVPFLFRKYVSPELSRN